MIYIFKTVDSFAPLFLKVEKVDISTIYSVHLFYMVTN